MNRAKFLVLGVLFAATPALAQDAPPPPPPPAASGGSATAAAAPAGDVSGPMIDRPLTMQTGKVGAYADFDYEGFSQTETEGTTTASASASLIALHGGVAYGVNDQLTVGVDYTLETYESFSIAGMSTSDTFPNNGEGPIALYGDYSLLSKGPLSVAATGALDIVNSGGTNSTTNLGLTLGASVRYKITPQINIFTGQPIPMGILGQQIAIGLNNSQETTLSIPVGAGYQVSPQIYAYVDTVLAEFVLANAPAGGNSSEFIFSDVTPLYLGGFYAMNPKMDVGAEIGFPDLSNVGSLYTFALAARWHQ